MRVFIVAPPIHDGVALSSAFGSLGHDSSLYSFQNFRPRNLLGRVLGRLSRPYRRWVIRRSFNLVLERQVIPEIARVKPDLLIIMKPERLTVQMQRAIAATSVPIYPWAIDSLSRASQQLSVEPIARHSFVVDGGDTIGDRRSWLPLGYDESLFRQSNEKTWDLLFVGFLKQPLYSTRKGLFLETARSDLGGRLRCGFMGTTGYRRKDAEIAEIEGWDFLGYAEPHRYAEVIAASRVCVNIHQDDGIQPVNPTFFAIPGCRVCQVTDDRRHLAEWLNPSRDYVALGRKDFVGGLRTLFANPGRIDAVSSAGWEAARQNHTYQSRASTILDVHRAS